MNTFHWPRFKRVLCNDFLQQWKKIWIATLGVAGAGCIIYLTNLDSRSNDTVALFAVALLAGGLLFTSTIFADLHDPLQRFQYLTLPCSTLERFLSRYLLSAPLFYLYVLIVYAVLYPLVSAIGRVLTGHSAADFAPFSEPAWQLTLLYFATHAVMFGGAIYFRSYAMMKTGVAVSLISLGITLVQFAAILVFYWDSISLMPFEVEHGINLPLAIGNTPVWTLVGVAFYLWLLYMAYQCACAITRCRMNFKPNYPIYLQVADFICEKVLTDVWHNGDKLPAVKDLAVLTSVNPNTVIKALTWLQDNDILVTQRGIGYFLTEGAADKTLTLKRQQFIEEDLPEVFASMQLLDVGLDELATHFQQYQQQPKNGNAAVTTHKELQHEKE